VCKREEFVCKGEELIGEWRMDYVTEKLHNEERYDLYSSPNITRLIELWSFG
jgi:hypothetical protein